MRIAIDTETKRLLTWGSAPISSLQATRHDRFPVELRFLAAGSYAELPAEAEGRLSVKRPGDFAGPTLAAATSWVKSGVGARSIYAFDLGLGTAEIATLFSEEPASIDLVLEIQWTIGSQRLTATPVPLVLANDYIRESDGTPAAALDLQASRAEAISGTTNTKWMSPLRTSEAIYARSIALSLALS
jgi:hypothetical protein